MYEHRATYVLRKHRTDYRDRGDWGTTKTSNIREWSMAGSQCQNIRLKRNLSHLPLERCASYESFDHGCTVVSICVRMF